MQAILWTTDLSTRGIFWPDVIKESPGETMTQARDIYGKPNANSPQNCAASVHSQN